MRARTVNLARKRFVNSRPVTRLSTILWLVGLLLLAANLWSYYGYFIGRGASSARLLEVEGQLSSERDRLRQLEGDELIVALTPAQGGAVFTLPPGDWRVVFGPESHPSDADGSRVGVPGCGADGAGGRVWLRVR